MRTGRPVKEETPYKIIIHRNGGRRYASTKVAIVGEDGKKQYRHKHWGSLDDDNRFHPNATYFNTAPAERAKLIFPEGWKLDEATGRGEGKRGREARQDVHLLHRADPCLIRKECVGIG